MKIKVHDEIVNDIMTEINTGVLSPGEKLPTNRELAEKYDTSEVTVRKSISTLSRMGFIESVERVGTFVKKKDQDKYSIAISPYVNITEEITDESIESIYLSLITMGDQTKLFHAVETRKILYSESIPVSYMIYSLLINSEYNPISYVKVIEKKQEMIDKIINSFEVKKVFEITMDPPDNYVYKKLFLREEDPILCFTIYYYTKDDNPVAKSVYFVAGENIELKGNANYRST